MPFLLNEDLWPINADEKKKNKNIEEKNRDPDARNQQNIKPSRIKYIRYKKIIIKINAGDKELKIFNFNIESVIKQMMNT